MLDGVACHIKSSQSRAEWKGPGVSARKGTAGGAVRHHEAPNLANPSWLGQA
jgi:hypothetical protein